jgi:hypothetical protein
MKKLFSEIKIDTSPEKVWNVLTDFEKYPQWNPFIFRIHGAPKEGEKLEVVMQKPDSNFIVSKPTVLKVKPKQELRWLSKWGISGIFDGEHIFKIRGRGDAGVWFIQEGHFKGLFTPLFSKHLDKKIHPAFNKMNHALKKRVEKNIK